MIQNPLEKDIEKAVKDYARSKGMLAYKFVSPGHSFVPDGIFIADDGRVFFIEFKRLGCKPTAGQQREINRMSVRGCDVFVVDSVDTGKAVIDAYC